LQRDLIGIRGGFNVYAYGRSRPVNVVDPTGLYDTEKGKVGAIVGGVVGVVGGVIGGASTLPALVGLAVVCAIGGAITTGYENGDAQTLLDEFLKGMGNAPTGPFGTGSDGPGFIGKQ
jgi:uncharacterized protein RhaS with RHS repeats